jgi:(p)ppGpp synthase/HD superfamily hydrolase
MVQAAAALTAPSYLDDLPLARQAFEFIGERHAGQVREGDAAPFLLHPLEVGALLHVFGYPERVVAAGLLHDVLEDSDTSRVELHLCFGLEIARLVEVVTEDADVANQVERKARLRQRVAAAGPEAGAVFAADKVSKAREIRLRAAANGDWADDEGIRVKLDHYAASCSMLRAELGDLPLVEALAFELEALFMLPPPSATRSRA